MKRDYVLTVRLSATEIKTLQDYASEQNVSVAEAVRDWLKALARKKRS